VSEPAKEMNEALAAEAESVERVNAAEAEQERGQPAVSLGLLMQAIEKERDSLDLLEQGMETLRQSLEDRRRALDQQEEILNQLLRG